MSCIDRCWRAQDQLIATGGDDCVVNVWKAGESIARRSLSGHSKPVTSVIFSTSEEFIIAGSQSGAIRVRTACGWLLLPSTHHAFMMQLFDVRASKVAKRLDGHMSTSSCIDVHPYNSIIVSGSYDTNVKLWDLKRGREYITFKGHSKPVTCVKFSPDGKWVASGSNDSTVKIWDLTAGKMMHSFDTHRGPVSSVDFHPEEFLLASGSHDRTVKLWDLESFCLHCTLPPDTQKVRAVKFVANGSAVLSGTKDGIRVMAWEPSPRVRNVVDVPWRHLSNMHLMKSGKVLGCALHDSVMSLWGVDLISVNPTLHPDGVEEGEKAAARAAAKAAAQAAQRATSGHESGSRPAGGAGPTRDSPAAGARSQRPGPSDRPRPTPRDARAAAQFASPPTRPPTAPGSGSRSSSARKPPSERRAAVERAEVRDPGSPTGRRRGEAPPAPEPRWSEDSFRRAALGGTAGKSSGTDIDTLAAEMVAALGGDGVVPPPGTAEAPAGVVRTGGARPRSGRRRHSPQRSPQQKRHVPVRSPLDGGSSDGAAPASANGGDDDAARRLNDDDILAQLEAASNRRPSEARWQRPTSARRRAPAAEGAGAESTRQSQSPGGKAKARKQRKASGQADRAVQSRRKKPESRVLVSSDRDGPIGLRYEDFLPKSTLSMSNGGKLRTYDADGVMMAVIQDRSSFLSVLQKRLEELRSISGMWAAGNLRSALTRLARLDKQAMTADFLRSADLKARAIKLESAVILLPLIVNLLTSSVEDYQSVAVRALSQLFADFSKFVLETRAAAAYAASRGAGVNISMEERLERCNAAHVQWERARPIVLQLSRKPGRAGMVARELHSELEKYFAD